MTQVERELSSLVVQDEDGQCDVRTAFIRSLERAEPRTAAAFVRDFDKIFGCAREVYGTPEAREYFANLRGGDDD